MLAYKLILTEFRYLLTDVDTVYVVVSTIIVDLVQSAGSIIERLGLYALFQHILKGTPDIFFA